MPGRLKDAKILSLTWTFYSSSLCLNGYILWGFCLLVLSLRCLTVVLLEFNVGVLIVLVHSVCTWPMSFLFFNDIFTCKKKKDGTNILSFDQLELQGGVWPATSWMPFGSFQDILLCAWNNKLMTGCLNLGWIIYFIKDFLTTLN